jgi:DNA integrity scanning protein DisA with diadenylate cyclase activity
VSAQPRVLDDVLAPVARSTRCPERRRRTVEAIVRLAVEIAREGREGRKIGTLFTVGDVDAVLEHSRALILDPLHGHPAELLTVERPEFRENVKELAQLDGAFVVAEDGTFTSAARYLDIDLHGVAFTPGLGTRHAAAASISTATRATAIVVSQSSVVRVYARGEVRAEIIPELFLLRGQEVFARQAEISRIPELGLTMAVAGADA